MRLGAMPSIVCGRFADLKQLCDLTDGNLNQHLAVLQETKLVALAKSADRRPVTTCTLTVLGRRRFHAYLDVLGAVVGDAREKATPAPLGRLLRA